MPYYMNYEQCYTHVLERQANCIAGTAVADTAHPQPFKVVAGDTALPEYRIPVMSNSCFDSGGVPGGSPPGWNKWSDDSLDPTVTLVVDTTVSAPYVCKIVFPRSTSETGKLKSVDQHPIGVLPNSFYAFKYWIKSEIDSVSDDSKKDYGIYMQVQGKPSSDSAWRELATSQRDSSYGKWIYRIQDSTHGWREKEFNLGVSTGNCTQLKIIFMANLPKNAPWSSITAYVDGDTVMKRSAAGDTVYRYFLTNQQKFLIKTEDAGPKVSYNNTPLVDGTDYELYHDTLYYHYQSQNRLNDSCVNWVIKIKNRRVPVGSTLKVSYNRVGYGDFTFNPYTKDYKFNYSPCPLEAKTKELVDASIDLLYADSASLKPRYVNPCYNEPMEGSLIRDVRAKNKNWITTDIPVGEDINYYFEKLNDYKAHDSTKPQMIVFADWMTPYHRGSEANNIWKARLVIDSTYRDSIIPLIWGVMKGGEYSSTPYSTVKESIKLVVNDLRSDSGGYTPVLWPIGGYDHSGIGDQKRKIRWLKALQELTASGSPADSTRGYFVFPNPFDESKIAEGKWKDSTTTTLNYWATIPIAMDLCWNLDTSRFVGTDSVKLCYSPETLHKNQGDIFSPPVANFRVDSLIPNGTVKVHLIWSKNLNSDRASPCYQLERYNWDAGTWDIIATKFPNDTAYKDTTPDWSETTIPEII